MKKIYTIVIMALLPAFLMAQGWPSNYGGVMLQGFYWDSYNDSKWTNLESQADELAEFFKLVWIPSPTWSSTIDAMFPTGWTSRPRPTTG